MAGPRNLSIRTPGVALDLGDEVATREPEADQIEPVPAAAAAQQPAAPKRSVRRVVGNTAKKTQITMIWCSTQQKRPPVRKRAGTLTTPAPVVTIPPPIRSCPR